MYYNIAWVIPQSQKNRTFTIFILQTKIAFYCGDVLLGSKLLTLLHKMTDMLDAKRIAAHQNKSDVRLFDILYNYSCLNLLISLIQNVKITCNSGCSSICTRLYWTQKTEQRQPMGGPTPIDLHR